MKDQLSRETPARRAAAYWFIDGFPEITAGAGFALLGGNAVWFHQIQHRSWPVHAMFLAIGVLSLLVVFVCGRSLSLFLKSRVTFPRTGYVRPPSDWDQVSTGETVISLGLEGKQRPPDQNVTRFRTSTIGVVMGGYILTGVIARPIGLPIAMSVVAILLYALNRRSERSYHWGSVLPLPLAGLAAMWMHLSQDVNPWIAVLLGGVWLLAQGAWSLLSYMRRYPKRYPVEQVLP
ncbi:MAG: hypothetical protein P4K98_05880 [Bryobacteraceae bacterium]|nr:hypothetical protein [Bryobacteraceae bacterium]